MPADLNFFDDDASERILQAVEWVDARIQTVNPQKSPLPTIADPQVPQVHLVRVTSTTQGTYGFPGFVSLLHLPVANPPTFDDGGACWVLDPNGANLLAQEYVARRTANAGDGKPIFETMAVVTVGWTGTFTATSVSDVSCSGGTLSKTTKVLTIVAANGLITVAPTYA